MNSIWDEKRRDTNVAKFAFVSEKSSDYTTIQSQIMTDRSRSRRKRNLRGLGQVAVFQQFSIKRENKRTHWKIIDISRQMMIERMSENNHMSLTAPSEKGKRKKVIWSLKAIHRLHAPQDAELRCPGQWSSIDCRVNYIQSCFPSSPYSENRQKKNPMCHSQLTRVIHMTIWVELDDWCLFYYHESDTLCHQRTRVIDIFGGYKNRKFNASFTLNLPRWRNTLNICHIQSSIPAFIWDIAELEDKIV